VDVDAVLRECADAFVADVFAASLDRDGLRARTLVAMRQRSRMRWGRRR